MSRDAENAATYLRTRGIDGSVEIAVVLGTGLGSLADVATDAVSVAYADIPGFTPSGVSGHAGRLVSGTLDGARVAILDGRTHYYERGDPAAMKVPLQTLAALGARTVIFTNSAGSLHGDWYPGSIVLIRDHINYSGLNPLIGVESDSRFVSMNDAYDPRLRKRMKTIAAATGVVIHEGVYMWFSGPSFETPAEVKMAKVLGADVVGMSTVPEVILARWLGLRVLCLSVITNFAAGVAGGNPTHAETKDVALSGSIGLRRLVRAFMRPADD